MFVVLSAYYRFHSSDDGFIYFRYVANVVAGHGPVWNVEANRSRAIPLRCGWDCSRSAPRSEPT